MWIAGQVLTEARLCEGFPDAIAGEMEGTAVYEAATRGVKPDWILVKAISDWGFGKSSDAQPQAAANAAEFVVHVIASGALRRCGRCCAPSQPPPSEPSLRQSLG